MLAFITPARALANGAFPDSNGILAPRDRPHQLMLGTNFGLLVTDDDGATWRWSCEQAIVSLSYLFQVGPPPNDRLFALGFGGLALSDDAGCSWTTVLEGASAPGDVFADPVDPERVLAIMQVGTTTPAPALVRSTDGGRTFPETLFVAPDGAFLQSVESARSDPETIYATMSAEHPTRRWFLRSTDGGAHFDTLDETMAIGGRTARIAAVDPLDPLKMYLRLVRISGDTGDSLGISTDGGMTVRLALQTMGAMTGFLARADGTLIVTAVGGSYFSSDGGDHFSPWSNTPKVRGLAERDGAIYAATDDLGDGFAVAVTRDFGMSWTPLLRFRDIQGPLQCGDIPQTCAQPWRDLMTLLRIGEDAGVNLDSGPGDSMSADADDAGTGKDSGTSDGNPPETGGCHCGATEARSSALLALLVSVLAFYPRRKPR